jgi:uncharacterized membrane protein
MKKLFSNEVVNKGRQIELDIARGLAVLFMVLIHTQENFSSDQAKETVLGGIIDLLGGIPAAPVFMFLLGIGIVYTRKSEPKIFIKRGLMLIGAGYLLSFMRGTLPNLFSMVMLQEGFYGKMALDTLTYVDIFQFSGLAMMLFGLIKKYKPTTAMVTGIAIGFAGLNLLLANVQTDNFWLAAFTGLFWGSNKLSFFPFLTWIFYPLVGYIFGTFLIRCTDKNKFYGIGLLASSILFCLSSYLFVFVLQIDTGLNNAEGYYHHQIYGNIIATSVVIIWLSLLHFMVKALPNWLSKMISRWSQNVSEIYFIHWVIIGWLLVFMGYNTLSLPYYCVLMGMIFIISDFLADYYVVKKKNRQ